MNLSTFIEKIDSIVRGKELEEFNLFIRDEYGDHHDFEFIVDKVNNDIIVSIK